MTLLPACVLRLPRRGVRAARSFRFAADTDRRVADRD